MWQILVVAGIVMLITHLVCCVASVRDRWHHSAMIVAAPQVEARWSLVASWGARTRRVGAVAFLGILVLLFLSL